MADEIRSYGPGKFSTIVDAYHDELSMPIEVVIGQMARSGGILGAF